VTSKILYEFYASFVSNFASVCAEEGDAMILEKKGPAKIVAKGAVHCPMCTHTVDAEVVQFGRRTYVQPGQKCPRCASSLDAAYILRMDRAA
jgi:uncharacterized protein (UPF0212 family)